MIPGPLKDEIERLAADEVVATASRFSESTRPRLAQLMVAAAEVAIRRGLGQDVSLAEQALATSAANLSLEEAGRLRIAGASIAFKAALVVVTRLLTP